MGAKSCKMPKKKKTPFILHIFTKKNIHISECKNIHKCTIASVIVHICTVIVALAFNILVIFFLSLSLVTLTLTSFSVFLIWSTSNHCRQSTHPNTTTDQTTRNQWQVAIGKASWRQWSNELIGGSVWMSWLATMVWCWSNEKNGERGESESSQRQWEEKNY